MKYVHIIAVASIDVSGRYIAHGMVEARREDELSKRNLIASRQLDKTNNSNNNAQ